MESNIYDREMAGVLAETQAAMNDPSSIDMDRLRKEAEQADLEFAVPEPGPGPRVYNEAGRDRPGWQIYGLDEKNVHLVMGLDTTGGQVADNDKNALLSDEAKDYMAWMHRVYPEECTPQFLARVFKIRVQRVMAIIALKKIEAEAQTKREQEEWDIVQAAQDKIKAAGSFDAAGYGRGSDDPPPEAKPEGESVSQTAEASDSQTAEQSGEVGASPDSTAAAATEESAESSAAEDTEEAAAIADGSGQDGAPRQAGAPGQTADSSGTSGNPGQAEDDDDDEEDWASDDEIPVKGGGNLGGKDLDDYRADPETGEIPGIVYATVNELREDEVDSFTKPMHTLDVTEALRDTIEHEIWDCVEAEGTYERHVKLLPSYPVFKEGPDGRLVHCGLTQEQLEEKAEMEAEEEEEAMIHMFERNLRWNLGMDGADVQRKSRITHPPRRPQKGWNLVVEPLINRKSKAKKQDLGPAFVAEPSGKQRSLTESEAKMLERTRPLPRRRVM